MTIKVEGESTLRNAMLFAVALFFSNGFSTGEVFGKDVQIEKESPDGKVRASKSANSMSGNGDRGAEVPPTGDVADTQHPPLIKDDKTGHSPSYLLMPSNMLAQEPSIRNGCWARIYGESDFEGGALTLTGPLSMPTMLGPFGINWKNRVRSIEVGKTAVLTVFDNVNFNEKIATIGPGKRVANLSKKMGYFDEFSSMKIACKI